MRFSTKFAVLCIGLLLQINLPTGSWADDPSARTKVTINQPVNGKICLNSIGLEPNHCSDQITGEIEFDDNFYDLAIEAFPNDGYLFESITVTVGTGETVTAQAYEDFTVYDQDDAPWQFVWESTNLQPPEPAPNFTITATFSTAPEMIQASSVVEGVVKFNNSDPIQLHSGDPTLPND